MHVCAQYINPTHNLTRPLYRALEESYKATVSSRSIYIQEVRVLPRLTPILNNMHASGDVEEDLQQSDATEPMFLDLLVSIL